MREERAIGPMQQSNLRIVLNAQLPNSVPPEITSLARTGFFGPTLFSVKKLADYMSKHFGSASVSSLAKLFAKIRAMSLSPLLSSRVHTSRRLFAS